MVVNHERTRREGTGERREVTTTTVEATRAAQGVGSARRASLLVYDSGLQGAFRFITLAHFEGDGQRKT
jgi:hypothetical protein